MPLHHWLQHLVAGLAPGRGQPRHNRRGSHRPNLEVLEDRTVLSFASPVGYATGANPYAMVTADVNGDGRLDIAVANYSYGSNSVSVLLGNADGTFQPAQIYATDAAPRSIAVGDFNGDT